MAPKRYTLERLNGVAADSAAKLKSLLQAVQNGDLTCEYLHPEQDATVKGIDTLNFLWKISASGCRDQCEVNAKCNNVVARAVVFPGGWKTALNCLTLSGNVRESSKG